METPTGMAGFITALTGSNGISATTFWDNVTPVAPLVVILIGFGFGYYVLRKVIKKAPKGKVTV